MRHPPTCQCPECQALVTSDALEKIADERYAPYGAFLARTPRPSLDETCAFVRRVEGLRNAASGWNVGHVIGTLPGRQQS